MYLKLHSETSYNLNSLSKKQWTIIVTQWYTFSAIFINIFHDINGTNEVHKMFSTRSLPRFLRHEFHKEEENI